jgi:hypothetical protein
MHGSMKAKKKVSEEYTASTLREESRNTESFEGSYSPHLQGQMSNKNLDCLTLKMDIQGSFKT